MVSEYFLSRFVDDVFVELQNGEFMMRYVALSVDLHCASFRSRIVSGDVSGDAESL